MYCNNGADRTIVKQNQGNWHLIGGGYLIGQERVPYRTSRTGQTDRTSRTAPASENPASAASDSSDSSDSSDLSDLSEIGTPEIGTPAPPSWLPHIMDNELLLKGGETPLAGVPIDRL